MAIAIDLDRLERDVPRDARLAIDTSAVIAYLHGGERASPAASWVFDGCLVTGRNPGLISAISVAELMVGPSKAGASAIATMEGFLRFFADMRIVSLDESVARAAARIRATTGLSLHDAAVVATALEAEATIIVTNDGHWQGALRASSLPIGVCLLREYATA